MSDFTVTRPQPYFHKPGVVLATNVPGPVPVGIVVPEGGKRRGPVEMTLDLPAGVDLLAAPVGRAESKAPKAEAGQGGGKRYRLAIPAETSNKTAVRLYLQAGGKLKLRLRVPAKGEIRDLLSGKTVREIAAGEQVVEIPLEGARARLLHVRPSTP